MKIASHGFRKLLVLTSLLGFVAMSLASMAFSLADYPFIHYAMFGKKLAQEKFSSYAFASEIEQNQIGLIPRQKVLSLSQQGVLNFFNQSDSIKTDRGFRQLGQSFFQKNQEAQTLQLLKVEMSCNDYYQNAEQLTPNQYTEKYGSKEIVKITRRHD